MPKVIESKKFLKIVSFFAKYPVGGISIFPFIIVEDKSMDKLIRHETIHYHQTVECFILGFYILYLYYYLRNRFRGMSHFTSYTFIPFEVEAYSFEHFKSYKTTRKKYKWVKFV